MTWTSQSVARSQELVAETRTSAPCWICLQTAAGCPVERTIDATVEWSTTQRHPARCNFTGMKGRLQFWLLVVHGVGIGSAET
jgi:hypothetical protein